MLGLNDLRKAAVVVVCLLAAPAAAGVALFDAATDTIAVSGQTVFGTAGTYEAIMLFPTSLNGGGRVFNEWQDFAEDKFLAVYPGVGGGVYGFNYGVSPDVMAGLADVTPDAWHHVAYVYDGSEERLYLDGTRIQNRAVSGDVSEGDFSVANVGAIFRDGSLQSGFVGLIDVLRLSNVARYAGTSFTPPGPDLASDANTVLLFTFDEPPGSATIADGSSLARTGTLGGGSGAVTSPVLCGDDATDLDGDFIPDSCDPTPPPTTSTTTTSSSTSSSAPGSTVTPTTATTTTTLAGCSTAPAGTIASIVCRVEALLARVNGEPALGTFQAKLAHTLSTAGDRAREARDLCAAANVKKTKARLKQVERAVIQYRHRLSGLPARKRLDPTVRQDFLAPADPLRNDVKTLRGGVRCPDDAA